MSEYGIKIKNYEAGSIHGIDLGVRSAYDCKDAMLTNSLFLDYLKENGLNIHKGESTRDVICINFRYGTRSFDEELRNIKKAGREFRLERKAAMASGNEGRVLKAQARKAKLNYAYKQILANEGKFQKTSADELRIKYYEEGVRIKYPKRNGEFEIIEYRMLYRTPGKAKKGSCMFIRKSLYKKAREFLYMGIKLPKKNAPIVEIGAYSSLITSSIEGRIKIDPSEILVIKDVDSFFKTNVVSIEVNENNECKAVPYSNYEVVSTLFDGQALIDASIFPSWGNGYILLRQHMFKAAAFSSNIQLFFKDYFGDKYKAATVVDMWGRVMPAKQVKLITTENACKFLKFNGITFDYWSEWVRKNDSLFGIVKTAHHSKLGDVQRMSYQMVNTLDINSVQSVMRGSMEYIHALRTDDNTFLDYLRRNANFSKDYEVLVALCEHNPRFVQCDYFKQRRNKIVLDYVANMKTGRIIQNADNLTIVGSPYAMLLHSVGEDWKSDPTFKQESDAIQCWTNRFGNGEYLAEFRNPFNSTNNLGYLHNVRSDEIDKYMNLGSLCIAVNMIETDFQSRNNGSDQDSDSIYTTNQSDIVTHAKWCYANKPTIVNNIPKDKNIYDSSLHSFAIVDNALSASQTDIGESSNLAQICLSYSYNFQEQKYEDAVCILSVVAQCSIDSAKRRFCIDIPNEIKRIKKLVDVKGNGYPFFWLSIRRGFNPNLINKKLECPMNALCGYSLPKLDAKTPVIPFSEFFVAHRSPADKKLAKKVESYIQKYSIKLNEYNVGDERSYDDYLLLRYDYDELVSDIRDISVSKNSVGLVSWLINRAFIATPRLSCNSGTLNSKLHKNKSLLLKTLYDANPKVLLSCFK